MLPDRINAEWLNFKTAPRWRVYLWVAVAVCGLVYLAWCRWGSKPVKPGQTVIAVTPKAVANEPTKTVQPKQVIVYRDKVRVVEKLGMSPTQPNEEVQKAAVIPPLKYGGTSATYLNISTGQSREEIKANAAPLFQFERRNTVGLEGGMGIKGRYFQGDYQRDIVAVKGVIFGLKASVTSYQNETDARIGVRAQYEW